MKTKEDMISYIEKNRDTFIDVSSRIWDYAETCYEEHQSAKALAEVLAADGFRLQQGVADMDTAFIAEWGEGEPVIGFLGEYDALVGLSQKAGCTTQDPEHPGAPGHGCGHHILGTGAMAAAMALRHYMEDNAIPGTVRYYGCPAEEGGGGKLYLARAGLFDDAKVAITWHPTDDNNIWSMNFMAVQGLRIRFTGIAAHSASQGHLGRNALSAVELTNIAANYLRGHVQRDVCINYAVTDTGGSAPNVIQASGEVVYNLRAYTYQRARETAKRIEEIAQGAAMMTGTRVVVEYTSGLSELVPNRALERIAFEQFQQVGVPAITEEDQKFCAEIHRAFPENSEESTFSTLRYLYGGVAEALIPQIRGKAINDVLYPYTEIPHAKYGSTDVCDVSWFTPTVQVTTACYAKDTPGHSWQEVAQGKQPLCFAGMLCAAKVMALTGKELVDHPEKLAAVRKEFGQVMQGKTYISPIPEGGKPSKDY